MSDSESKKELERNKNFWMTNLKDSVDKSIVQVGEMDYTIL